MEEGELTKPTLPLVPDKCGPPTINLNFLLDFAVQQIYHEITVLTELLPKKQDPDKKISLVQFAHSTRMLFVKLLAVVKWVKSSKKFESCSSICYLLDQQSQYFIETADRLVTLSREELVLARLPAFQVCAAVDVLTQGSYPRLPLCIKDRFIRQKKITPREEANVLLRINQVLQYRISKIASKMSPRIKDVIIKNGIVSLVVPGEFEVQLTVLGETENLKWTLLNIKILVEDYEIGYGTQLVHPLQLNMLHNVLQSRMDVSKNPINEVYNYLHTFAQSLQLDVLYCQTSQLVAGRLRNKIVIEKYNAKERTLSIGYWVQRVAQRKGSAQIRHVPQYRVLIYGDKEDADSSLKVRHFPSASNLGVLDDRTGRLSVDRLLSEILVVRCRERLLRIRKRLEAAEPKALVVLTGSAAPCLSLPLLRDSVYINEECVTVSVNMFSGRVLCTLIALESTAGSRNELRELEKALYDGQSVESLRKLLDRLKILLMIERYRRSVATLQVRIINEAQMAPFFKKVHSLPSDRICMQFIKEEHFYLVVTFEADENLTVQMGLYLLCTLDEKTQMMELNREKQLIAAPIEQVIRIESSTYGNTSVDDEWVPACKRRRLEPSMERQLTSAVAAVDDRISFMRVCEELDKKGIRYNSIEAEPEVGGLTLHITDVSKVVDLQCAEFFRNMVRCCLRLDNRSRVLWPFECCMINIPLVRDVHPNKRGSKVCSWVQDLTGIVVSSSTGPTDSISQVIIDRLSRYCNIYDIVSKFAKAYDAHYHEFCSVQAYTFHKLVIAYGDQRDQQLIVSFRPRNNINDRFNLNFGQTLPRNVYDMTEVNFKDSTRWNAHCMMASILKEKFNVNADLVELVHYLVSTCDPLHSLAAFSRIRFQSCKVLAQLLFIDIPYPIRLKCHLTPINEYTIRLTYGHLHLEFALLEGKTVAVRDSCRGQPKCAGLHQFFLVISNGTAKSCASDAERKGVKRSSSPSQPASLPSNMVGASPLAHPSSSLSVPNTLDSSASPIPYSQLFTTTSPIIIDHSTLSKACTFVDSGSGMLRSPLDDYLFALVFLNRLAIALEAHRRIISSQKIPISDLQSGLDFVRISVATVCPPPLNSDPSTPHTPLSVCNISFYFHLDPISMNIKLTLDYVGKTTPAISDVCIMERYFEQIVCRLNNEMAVFSFINLCRLTAFGASAGVAQIMSTQMDPPPLSFWTVAYQLVYLSRDSANGSNRRFNIGAVFDSSNTNMLILICFRPSRTSIDRTNEKHLLRLVYNMQTNVLKQQGLEDENTTAVLSACSQEAVRTGECPLWPAVRQFIDRFSSANVAGMPSSVGCMPGSVGPVSVGPVGSVGGPVSVGPVGSVGLSHNPGSILNPGSNT